MQDKKHFILALITGGLALTVLGLVDSITFIIEYYKRKHRNEKHEDSMPVVKGGYIIDKPQPPKKRRRFFGKKS